MTSEGNVFGANLLCILRNKGIKQSELAQKIGVTQSCLSRWINGHRALHVHQRAKICAALDIVEEDFFYPVIDPENENKNLGPLF